MNLPIRITIRTCGALAALLIAVPPAPRALVASLEAQGAPVRGRLYQDSRAELAAARARGESTATLVIAARPGANAAVARAVQEAGGTVQYRSDEVSYLRADVPIDRADAIADGPDVESAAVDVSAMITRGIQSGVRDIETPDLAAPGHGAPDADYEAFASLEPQASPRSGAQAGSVQVAGRTPAAAQSATASPQAAKAAQAPGWPPTWSDYPLRHPYSPVDDLGAGALRKAHPTYDGRGIVVGHVEMGFDVLLPEFERAYTLDGKPVAKVLDIMSTTDPAHVHEHAGRRRAWASMTQDVQAATAKTTFTAEEKSFTPARSGTFRFGVLDAKGFCDYIKRFDPEAPPKPPFSLEEPPPPDTTCKFGVLWDPQSQEVWVDTNRDASFADEKPIKDFRVNREMGLIGRDEPDTPEREQFAYSVQIDAARKAVAINLLFGGHATMVAGSVAGSKGSKGLFDGVAPGAQIIAFDYGGECVASTIEGFIAAFSDPRVDLVLFEQNVWIAMPYRLGDGKFTATLITSRLIDKYKKPFVVPGDNTPGMNAVSEHGNATFGFAAGAWESADSWRINDGINVKEHYNLHHVGSWGPSGQGGIKPDVIVPSGYLTNETPGSTYARGGVKGLYRFPPGYGIGGGTSQAAPTLTGALTLLMSAAKQEQVPYDAERIWKAVTYSAREAPNLAAHQQGNGAVDVEAALTLLKAYAKTPPTINIVSRAPVRTPYSGWHETPHEGIGLWESEGWRAGQRGTRTVTLTRTSGPREPMTFAVSWRRNDGTFSSDTSVVLPLNQPVPLTVTIAPATPGAHSALLTLDHGSIPGHALRMMAAIIAARPFEAEQKFTFNSKDFLPVPGPFLPFSLDVPVGTEALSVASTGSFTLSILDPIGRRYWVSGGTRTLGQPRGGSWELQLRTKNDSLDAAWMALPGEKLTPRTPYTLDVTPLAARIEAPASIALEPGVSRTVDVRVTNAFGAFDGSLVPMAIGAARSTRETLAAKGQKVFDIQVPQGSPLFIAELTSVSATEGDVDLYLFDCTGKRCRPAGAALGALRGTGDKLPRFVKGSPKAGSWKVVVDAARVASSGVTIEYRDVVADPALGGVTVADAPQKREPGAQWSAPANVWLVKRPDAGRVPAALLVATTTKDGVNVPVGVRTVAIESQASTAAAAAAAQAR